MAVDEGNETINKRWCKNAHRSGSYDVEVVVKKAIDVVIATSLMDKKEERS